MIFNEKLINRSAMLTERKLHKAFNVVPNIFCRFDKLSPDLWSSRWKQPNTVVGEGKLDVWKGKIEKIYFHYDKETILNDSQAFLRRPPPRSLL